jgi:solute carrier family 25 citrate transporter 1
LNPLLKTLFPTNSSAQSAGIGGFIAGAVTTVLNQPIDVVKTHMNADQAGSEKPKFISNYDCANYIWRQGGIKAYSSGLSARIMKISIGQAVIFSVYDKVQKLL